MQTDLKAKPRKPLRNIIIRVIVCALVLAVGVIGMSRLASLKQPPAKAQNSERPLPVDVIRVEPKDVDVTITGYGEVRALRIVPISPEVGGRVVSIHPRLRTGEIIPSGELLLEIDTRNYRATVKEARSEVQRWKTNVERLKKQNQIDSDRLQTLERNRDLARAEFDRLRSLFERDSVGTRSAVDRSEQNYNAAVDQVDMMAQQLTLYPIQIKETESGLRSAQARLELALANLERCRIRSPFTARIKTVAVEKNQYLVPGQAVLTLADDSILEIQVPLDSRDARKWLRFDQTAQSATTAWFSGLRPVAAKVVWTEDPQANTWDALLHRVVKFDPQTRTLTVALRIDAKNMNLDQQAGLPLVEGMFCLVHIPGRTMRQVFELPREAVSFDNTVYLAVDRRLKTVPVTVARIEGDITYVSQGLASGDTVVVTRLVDPLENALLETQVSEQGNPS